MADEVLAGVRAGLRSETGVLVLDRLADLLEHPQGIGVAELLAVAPVEDLDELAEGPERDLPGARPAAGAVASDRGERVGIVLAEPDRLGTELLDRKWVS